MEEQIADIRAKVIAANSKDEKWQVILAGEEPITLEDVLIALEVHFHSDAWRNPYWLGVDDMGRFIAIYGYGAEEHCDLTNYRWKLGKSLNRQEASTVAYVHSILCS